MIVNESLLQSEACAEASSVENTDKGLLITPDLFSVWHRQNFTCLGRVAEWLSCSLCIYIISSLRVHTYSMWQSPVNNGHWNSSFRYFNSVEWRGGFLGTDWIWALWQIWLWWHCFEIEVPFQRISWSWIWINHLYFYTWSFLLTYWKYGIVTFLPASEGLLAVMIIFVFSLYTFSHTWESTIL